MPTNLRTAHDAASLALLHFVISNTQPKEHDMTDIQRWRPTVRMHQTVAFHGLVFTAGQVADATAGRTVAEQTVEILARIDELLKEAGTCKHRLLSATVYLADIATFDAMNAIWDQWVAPDGKPVRTTIEARLTSPDFSVEISVIAAI
jgi:enamine deaminase RidA (YjgF/YER057c/UK114 family)